MADLGDGTAANLFYKAPTLYAAGQTVTYEYHVFLYKSHPTMKSWPQIAAWTSFTGRSRRCSPMEDKEEDAREPSELMATAAERLEESGGGRTTQKTGIGCRRNPEPRGRWSGATSQPPGSEGPAYRRTR